MITRATVAQLKTLWIDLIPMWERNLSQIHVEMERTNDWPEIRALQARAVAIRAFVKLPDDLASQFKLTDDNKE